MSSHLTEKKRIKLIAFLRSPDSKGLEPMAIARKFKVSKLTIDNLISKMSRRKKKPYQLTAEEKAWFASRESVT